MSNTYYLIGVMLLYIILAAIGFVLISILLVTQRFYLNNLLEAPRTKRMALMKEKNDEEVERIKQGHDSYENVPAKPINYVFMGLFLAAFIVAWVLFFVYSANGQIGQ